MKKIRKLFLFLLLLTLSFTVTYASVKAAALAVVGVDIIYTNPGEDCMTEMTISWHSSAQDSTLVYTKATDKNYENAITVNVKGVFDNTSFVHYDVCSFYKCVVELTNLTPDTNYIYKVSTGSVTSREHKFKTAGTSDFTFGYMSDIHAVDYDNLDRGMTAVKKMQTVQRLLNSATKTSGQLSFMLTTGDEVWRGSQYSNWLEWSKNQYTTATEDYMWAGAPGNHEYYTQTTSSVWNYYPDKYASNTSSIYSDKEYFYNTYFNAIKAVPQNGPEGIESCYYFLYNNVLFICIDSMQGSEYAHLEQIRNWFEEVVQANEGNYQYIIAYQHYHWYDFQTGTDKHYSRWNDLFDKYGVDLALSGHMHGYLRTKSLYAGKVSDDETKGTTYVVSPQVGDRPKEITGYENQDLFAMRESTVKWEDYSAMSTISVTKEGLTYKLLDVNGQVKDEFTLKAKREFTLKNSLKEETKKSVTASSNASSVSVNIDPSYNPYVKSVQLVVDNQTVKSCSPSTKKESVVTVSGLQANSVHTVKMTVTYIDDTKYQETFNIVTTNNYLLLNTMNLASSNGKMKLTWDVNENVASKYKIYLNDVEEATVDGTQTSYDIDLSKVTSSTKYTIQALNASNEVIYLNDAYYNMYGDANLDGKIDASDVDALINMIFAGKEFTKQEIKLLDNNNDGKVDIGDAFKILSKANNVITSVKTMKYNVVVVDASGNVLNVSQVEEGQDFTYVPTLNGKTFKGYSKSTKNITQDLVLVANFE